MKFSLRKKLNKLLVYEISLLLFALGVVLFDFVYIMGNPTSAKAANQVQEANMTSLTQRQFVESCQGVDLKSEDLKTAIQRGLCNFTGSLDSK